MTIYVHFNIRAAKTAVKIHNVDRVVQNGEGSIRVYFMFSDECRVFTDVSHVALTPELE
jgi:hypothetical protein